jgi:nucleoside phosphorylase
MSLALAWSTRMGSLGTSPVVASLVERLQPRCLAMCGVCAGNPSDVALGDVIVAELAYAYDEGKRTDAGFEGDYRLIPISHEWLRRALALEPQGLPSYGPPTTDDIANWLLEQFAAGRDPRRQPALKRYVTTNEAWVSYLEALAAEGLLVSVAGGFEITEAGRMHLKDRMFRDITGPARLPFAIAVGPMTSGNVVVKDGRTWDSLRTSGVRTVIGLDMESAAIAMTAYVLRVAEWAVVKGVMDHANPRKDDRYKRFAARASSEVLLELLAGNLAHSPSPAGGTTVARFRRAYVIGGETEDASQDQVLEIGEELGETIARADVDLVVCSPFDDSLDATTVRGYLQAGGRGTIHFHSPRDPAVDEQQAKLLSGLRHDDGQIRNWRYPGPEDGIWSQAWLLCQLQALDHADVVIAVGGRRSHTAATLLHLAEARRIPIVPYALLGGASAAVYDRRKDRMPPEVPKQLLLHREGVRRAMDIANAVVGGDLRPAEDRQSRPSVIFISRASRDGAHAEALRDALSTHGFTVRLGDDEIREDRLAVPTIEDALLTSDLAIVLWSAAYALSPFCSDELEVALQRDGVGELQVWICNLDASDVVPRAARRLPQAVTRTREELVEVVIGLLDAPRPAD